jgi:hypothetical protein
MAIPFERLDTCSQVAALVMPSCEILMNVSGLGAVLWHTSPGGGAIRRIRLRRRPPASCTRPGRFRAPAVAGLPMPVTPVPVNPVFTVRGPRVTLRP